MSDRVTTRSWSRAVRQGWCRPTVSTTNWADVFRTTDHVKHYFIEYDFPPDPYFTAENGFEYLSCLTY